MATFIAQRSIQTLVSSKAPSPGKIADATPHHIKEGLWTSKQVVTVTPVAANAATYTLIVDGVSFSYVSDADGTAAEISAGLIALVNAAANLPVTASGSSTVVLTADVAGNEFAYSSSSTAGSLTSVLTTGNGAQLADGKFVIRDTAGGEHAIKLPTQASDITGGLLGFGVTMCDDIVEVRTNLLGSAAPLMKNVLRKGHIWVQVEEAVTESAQVTVRYAAGGLGLGSFGTGTGTSERAILAGAVYVSGASGNGFAKVELNLKA
jgi:hypothetical protein